MMMTKMIYSFGVIGLVVIASATVATHAFVVPRSATSTAQCLSFHLDMAKQQQDSSSSLSNNNNNKPSVTMQPSIGWFRFPTTTSTTTKTKIGSEMKISAPPIRTSSSSTPSSSWASSSSLLVNLLGKGPKRSMVPIKTRLPPPPTSIRSSSTATTTTTMTATTTIKKTLQKQQQQQEPQKRRPAATAAATPTPRWLLKMFEQPIHGRGSGENELDDLFAAQQELLRYRRLMYGGGGGGGAIGNRGSNNNNSKKKLRDKYRDITQDHIRDIETIVDNPADLNRKEDQAMYVAPPRTMMKPNMYYVDNDDNQINWKKKKNKKMTTTTMLPIKKTAVVVVVDKEHHETNIDTDPKITTKTNTTFQLPSWIKTKLMP